MLMSATNRPQRAIFARTVVWISGDPGALAGGFVVAEAELLAGHLESPSDQPGSCRFVALLGEEPLLRVFPARLEVDWLRPYVDLNIGLFARDLELDMAHIVNTPSGKVWLFSE